MAARATMREVAALAGVSLKTVSRVVNREGSVSSDVVARVERACGQLGYRRNLAASALRSGTGTRSIALLVQDVGNEFSAALLRAVDDVARRSGVLVLTASLDEEDAREQELVADLIGRRVDGLILMPATESQAYLQPEIGAGFEVVVIDRPARHLAVDSVLCDNVGGARSAVRHLLEHGHRRIALVCDDPRIASAAQRREGWASELRAWNVEPEPELAVVARNANQCADAVRALLALPDPPTAIFAARNVNALGVVEELHRLGLQHRVALIGFDEIPVAHLLQPGLTTVEQDPAAIGARAAHLLLARMGGEASAPNTYVLPTHLVARGSGELPPP